MTGFTHFDRAIGHLANTSSSGHRRKRQRFPLHNIIMRFVLFMVALVMMSMPIMASMSGPPVDSVDRHRLPLRTLRRQRHHARQVTETCASTPSRNVWLQVPNRSPKESTM